jgi:Holliday junction resolvasome RuvABC endonuclease subunit
MTAPFPWLVAVDGGLAELGLAALDLDGMRVRGTRLLSTKRETKKRKLHVGSDDARRIDALLEGLDRFVEEHGCDPVAIAYELPSAAKGARAGHALGIAHGMVRAWGRVLVAQLGRSIPLIEVTVGDARLAAVGRPSGKATETEAHAALTRRFTNVTGVLSVHELDAIAVGLAAIETPVGRALRGARA